MAGKFSNLVEPGEQIAEMLQNLLNARKVLETKKQYRQARSEDVATFLKQAETYTRHAAGLFERNPELSGDTFIAFRFLFVGCFPRHAISSSRSRRCQGHSRKGEPSQGRR